MNFNKYQKNKFCKKEKNKKSHKRFQKVILKRSFLTLIAIIAMSIWLIGNMLLFWPESISVGMLIGYFSLLNRNEEKIQNKELDKKYECTEELKEQEQKYQN